MADEGKEEKTYSDDEESKSPRSSESTDGMRKPSVSEILDRLRSSTKQRGDHWILTTVSKQICIKGKKKTPAEWYSIAKGTDMSDEHKFWPGCTVKGCISHRLAVRISLESIRSMDADEYESACTQFQKNTKKKGDCIVWNRYIQKSGYGVVGFLGRMHPAHLIAFCLANLMDPDDIPKGHVVRHRCRNRSCCNEEHLELAHIRTMPRIW
jgi:hypothetical protein